MNFLIFTNFQVIEAFEKDGFEFLRQVFNVPKYLEDMVGLTALHESIVYSDVSYFICFVFLSANTCFSSQWLRRSLYL